MKFGRVPTEEEIDHVFHLTRVMWKAVWACTINARSKRKAGSLRSSSTTYSCYARISTTGQTLVKRNPFYWMIYGGGRQSPGSGGDLLVGHTGTRIQGGSFLLFDPPAPLVRQSSVVASTSPDRVERGTGNVRLGSPLS